MQSANPVSAKESGLRVPVIFSLAGGLLIVVSVGGLLASGQSHDYFSTAFGVLPIAWGLVIAAGGIGMSLRPNTHQAWGALVLVLSLLSATGFSVADWVAPWSVYLLGYLLVGEIISFMGGLLAVVLHPRS